MEIAADLLAGLGLFFVGIRLIGGNLREMSGRWFRRLIARATGNPALAALVGTLSGAVTQSSSAITFIVVSLISAGLLGIRRAVPLVVWANVGTSILVLLAVVDLRLLVLYLLAATGLGYFLNLDRAPRWRHALGSALGVALLFLGIVFIKESGGELRAVPAVADFLAFAAGWPLLAFVVGAGLTLVAQSSATVSVVAVTLTTAGVLTLDQTALLVFGASLGSGLSVWLLSANLTGSGRQLALVQVLAKVTGVVLLLPVYVAGQVVELPGGAALLAAATAAPDQAVALLYLALQLVAALAMSVLGGPVLALAARAAPESEEERLSRPRYLYDQAVEDPETAVELVRREQARILGHLPALLDTVRPEAAPAVEAATLLEASRNLTARCEHFLTELLDATSSRDLMLAVLQLEKRNQLLGELLVTADQQLAGPYRGLQATGGGRLDGLLRALVESQHALLLTALDALAHETDSAGASEPDEVALLLALSGDRSEAMDELRRRVAGETRLTAAEHEALYAATALFERTVWLVRRYALLIGREAAAEV
ncbi:MAG: Na/Pi symporter [Thalassobaculum sp.]|uniref:Na/Pi symporter n=1 Tax=Thalassobaculum sp. TaxID=2022740 RepID=UPI0032EE0489